jgi:hypothetical protein
MEDCPMINWKSKVTKNHIKQAELAGYRLVGSGKNSSYRKYTCLKCDDEKFLQPPKVKIQASRVAKRGKKEKYCWNCRLLHDMDAACAKINAEYLGNCPSKKGAYHRLRLTCGHIESKTQQQIVTNTLSCVTCKKEEAKLAKASVKKGWILAGPPVEHKKSNGKPNHNYKRFRNAVCGHFRDISRNTIYHPEYVPRCYICIQNTRESEANEKGFVLLGLGQKKDYGRYQCIECKYEKELQYHTMRHFHPVCDKCFRRQLAKDAQKIGWTYKRDSKKMGYGWYAHNVCGNEQEISYSSIKKCNVNCQSCQESSRTKPSNLYLLRIEVKGMMAWLKLGYACDISLRVTQYGLPDNHIVSPIQIRPVATGNEAHALEQLIRKKFESARLPKEQMYIFHTKSGASECYPLELQAKLECALWDV